MKESFLFWSNFSFHAMCVGDWKFVIGVTLATFGAKLISAQQAARDSAETTTKCLQAHER